MDYFTTDQHGITIIDPTSDQRRRVLQSILDDPHADFPEVYLNCRGSLVLGYRQDGCLLWEESGETIRYLPGADLDLAMRAWDLLVENNLKDLRALAWKNIE